MSGMEKKMFKALQPKTVRNMPHDILVYFRVLRQCMLPLNNVRLQHVLTSQPIMLLENTYHPHLVQFN